MTMYMRRLRVVYRIGKIICQNHVLSSIQCKTNLDIHVYRNIIFIIFKMQDYIQNLIKTIIRTYDVKEVCKM